MRYRLAHATQRVPMPERGGALFTGEKSGESINPLDPYYARMIADQDLIPVEEEASAGQPDKPAVAAEEPNRQRSKGA